MAGEYKDKLAAMQESWEEGEKAQQEGYSGDNVPAGLYACQLQATYLKETQNGNLRIVREHLITEGENEGRVIFDGLMPGNRVGAMFTRNWFGELGIEPPSDVAQLEEYIDAISKCAPTMKLKLKYKNEFANVRYVDLIDDGGLQEAVAAIGSASTAPKAKKVKTSGGATSSASDENLEAARTFCATWEIDITDDMDIAALKKAISAYTYSKKELDAEEHALLEALGLKKTITA